MDRIQAAASHEVRAYLFLRFTGEADAARLDQFRHRLIDAPETLHCIDCSGSFDFLAEAAFATLDEYQQWIDDVRLAGRALVETLDHCLVCRRHISQEDDHDALWLPTADGRRRVPLSLIDVVEADGDYVRVVVGGASQLMHATLRSLEQRLLPAGFLKLHRSLIVRSDLVEELVHDERGWLCRLRDGGLHRLPRARVHAVRVRLGAESSSRDGISTTTVSVQRHSSELDRSLDDSLLTTT